VDGVSAASSCLACVFQGWLGLSFQVPRRALMLSFQSVHAAMSRFPPGAES
jgi:hypothetical protein